MTKINQIIEGMLAANLPSDYWISSCTELIELEDCHYIKQRNGQSVWEHTMSVIDLLTIKNPTTLLSGLFHDVGKSKILPMNDVSSPKFPGHAGKSATIAQMRLSEWGADPYLIDRVIRLVSTHMFDISNAMREKTIRKFVADVGVNNIENWFALRVADSMSYALQQKYKNYFIEPFRKAVLLYLDKQPIISHPQFEKYNELGSIHIEGAEDK